MPRQQKMPQRWISLRTRQRLDATHELEKVTSPESYIPTEPPKPPPKPAKVPTPFTKEIEQSRPQTASGLPEIKHRVQPQTGTQLIRPQTSDAASPPFNQDKFRISSQRDAIGMAIGSPTHTSDDVDIKDSLTPISMDAHAFSQQGPFPDRGAQTSKSKWKKFGSIFKHKQGNQSTRAPGEPFYKLQIDSQCSEALTSTTHTSYPERSSSRRRSNTVPSRDRLADEVDFFPRPPTGKAESVKSVSKDAKSFSRAALPKLQVTIPSAQMDRYTVMFGNVDGMSENSNLLKKRSKMLEQLQLDVGEPLPLPPAIGLKELYPSQTVPRRQSSPSASRPSTSYSLYPTISHSIPKTKGSFSLFPNTSTTTLKTTIKIPPPALSPRMRSMTSPARLSPMKDVFDSQKPKPLKVINDIEKVLRSPEETTTASTEHTTPWSADVAISPPSSVTTVDEEILFDIRSLRDSKGVDGHQFEMTRPTSSAVALYRTMSQKHQGIKSTDSEPPLPERNHTGESPIQSESPDIDEVIALVEKFGTPTTSKQVTPTKPHIGQLVMNSPRSVEKWLLESKEKSPGPVNEVIQRRTDGSVMKPVNGSSLPPPVPAKDNKLIPVSKYATYRSSSPSSNRSGGSRRPSRPLRSVTDVSILPATQYNPKQTRTQFAASKSEESLQHSSGFHTPSSGTFPIPTRAAHLQPILSQDPISTSGRHHQMQPAFYTLPNHHQQQKQESKQRLRRKPVSHQSDPHATISPASNPAITVIPAIIQPFSNQDGTEIAIARTISLSRKQSTRCLIPPPAGPIRRTHSPSPDPSPSMAVTKPAIGQPAAPPPLSKPPAVVVTSQGGTPLDDGYDGDAETRSVRMNLLDRRPYTPMVVVEVERGHRVGKSVDAVFECV